MTDTGDTKERKPDAFALSDEDFQAVMAEASAAGETGDTDARETPGDAQGAGDTGPQAASDQQPKNQPDKPFTLDEPPAPAKPPAAGGDQQPQMFEIVHNGQVHHLTREGVIALAQKGFDYDNKIGPHKKIVRLVESDPAVAGILDEYARTGRLPVGQAPPAEPPKLKPLTEYDNEIDWFKDNFEALQQMTQPDVQHATRPAAPAPVEADPARQPAAAPPAAGTDVQRIVDTLSARDPRHYGQVAPHLMEYANRYLTVEQYRQVNSSMANLVQFYDWVRDQVLSQGAAGGPPPETTAPAAAGSAPFRMQSGGGQPPREDSAKKAWQLPNKEFEAIIAKAKGY